MLKLRSRKCSSFSIGPYFSITSSIVIWSDRRVNIIMAHNTKPETAVAVADSEEIISDLQGIEPGLQVLNLMLQCVDVPLRIVDVQRLRQPSIAVGGGAVDIKD